MTPDRNLKCVCVVGWCIKKNYHASERIIVSLHSFNHTNNICRPLCYKICIIHMMNIPIYIYNKSIKTKNEKTIPKKKRTNHLYIRYIVCYIFIYTQIFYCSFIFFFGGAFFLVFCYMWLLLLCVGNFLKHDK